MMTTIMNRLNLMRIVKRNLRMPLNLIQPQKAPNSTKKTIFITPKKRTTIVKINTMMVMVRDMVRGRNTAAGEIEITVTTLDQRTLN